MLKDKVNTKLTLEVKRANKSKGLFSKRQTAPKKKTEETPNVLKVDPYYIAKEEAWLKFEITTQKELKKEDRQKRGQLQEFLFREMSPVFDLMSRSLEHAVKILDIYYGKCATSRLNFKGNIYPEKEELLSDFVAAIFMASKYNEVYPPLLMDLISFCQGQDFQIEVKTILENEIAIFTALDFNLHVTLVSDWWKIKYQKLMPLWAHLCFLDFDLKDKSKEIFEEIERFIEAVMRSSFREVYEEFVKESDGNWNTKEGGRRRRKFCYRRCKAVYKAFVEFREKNEISVKHMSVLKGSKETPILIDSKEKVN